MGLDVTRSSVTAVLNAHMERSAVAQAVGISRQSEVDGKSVPRGYWFDDLTQYWLPPNFKFLPANVVN